MGRFFYLLLLSFLVLPAPAFADDAVERPAAARLARLDGRRLTYEQMLRDAKTETAARYFVERLRILEAQRVGLEDELAASRPQPATPPAAPVLRRTDAWLRAQILEKVKGTGVALTDVVAWTRRELPEELATWWIELYPEGELLTRDAALAAWAGRAKEGWLSASYGSGTFIVVPPKRKPPKRGARPGKNAEIVLPKPPTRDAWWTNASAKARTAWVLAYFVEHSGLFELDAERISTACRMCHGEGMIVKVLQGGAKVRYLCPRCGGAQADASIRYR